MTKYTFIILALLSACVRQVPVMDYELSFQDAQLPTQLEEDQAPIACHDGEHVPGSGGAIKTWSSNETLTASALNGNFSHIHTLMVGGHGPRLVDTDVSASASISTSKLAAYHMIPVAWVSISDCTGSPCTIIASQGVTQVTRSGAGSYSVTLATPRPDTNYMGVVSPHRTAAGTQEWCYTAAIVSTSAVPVVCTTDSVPTPTDSAFSIAIYDNN